MLSYALDVYNVTQMGYLLYLTSALIYHFTDVSWLQYIYCAVLVPNLFFTHYKFWIITFVFEPA